MLTQNLEQVFYGRCAPSKRPSHLRDTGQGHLRDSNEQSPKEVEGRKEITLEGKQSEGVDSVKYDESLFKSLFLTFKHRIIWSCMLLLISGVCRSSLPFLSHPPSPLILWN